MTSENNISIDVMDTKTAARGFMQNVAQALPSPCQETRSHLGAAGDVMAASMHPQVPDPSVLPTISRHPQVEPPIGLDWSRLRLPWWTPPTAPLALPKSHQSAHQLPASALVKPGDHCRLLSPVSLANCRLPRNETRNYPRGCTVNASGLQLLKAVSQQQQQQWQQHQQPQRQSFSSQPLWEAPRMETI